MELLGVKRIWDQGTHNAFTDLIRFQDRWFCVFREGTAHVSPDGALRVITSADGEAWEPAALLASPADGYLDPKLTLLPDGRLLLTADAVPRGAVLDDPASLRDFSLAWTSHDGRAWTGGDPIGDPNMDLWRPTWHRCTGYVIGYGSYERKIARLYTSRDGARWETLVETLLDENFPNEATLRFLEDDTCLCLLRRDPDPATCLLGTALPPYTQWRWQETGRRVGGPNLVCLPDGRLLAAGRLYDGRKRTSLLWLERETATLTECLTLPSGGDSSYPGLVLHDDLLWVSYYSSHEGKTSIYLAKVRIPVGYSRLSR